MNRSIPTLSFASSHAPRVKHRSSMSTERTKPRRIAPATFSLLSSKKTTLVAAAETSAGETQPSSLAVSA